MGFVYENINLKNAGDVMNAQRGIINETDIRQLKVLAMVDTGAITLIINEAIRQELGLAVRGEQRIRLANESAQTCQYTDPVEIHWKNRHVVTQALVLAGVEEVLLGAIPLEGLDVIVDPANRELVGAHGDEIIYKIT